MLPDVLRCLGRRRRVVVGVIEPSVVWTCWARRRQLAIATRRHASLLAEMRRLDSRRCIYSTIQSTHRSQTCSDGGDESQATQLLSTVLEMGASSSKTSIHTSPHEDNTNISTVSGTPPRSLNGHYHYHGLATTQTDPGEGDESSQKENIGAKKTDGLPSRAVPHGVHSSLPSPPPSKASHPGPINQNTSRPLSRAIKVTNSPWLLLLWLIHPFKPKNKAVSFQSPAKAGPGHKNPSTTRTSDRKSVV